MTNNSSVTGHTTHRRACLAVTLALLPGLPACGDLDETDADPPSVNALALWDSSHVVAVRTYYKNPVIVDLQTGKQTATLSSEKYYEDIATIGNGQFICLQNQSLDFFRSDGSLDQNRSIPSAQFTGMAVSADRSTLAYALALDPTQNSIAVVDLPSGETRSPTLGVSFNLTSSLSVSRDGKLVAFAQGDVEVVATRAPQTTGTCVLDYDPRHPGGPLATAFSPAGDKLAVSKDDGGVDIFDVGQFPDCTLVSSTFSPEEQPPKIWHVSYSPDGSILAVSVEHADSQTGVMTGAVRLLDGGTGAVLKELSVYQWEMRTDPPVYGPAISDLQWSEAGDQLSVSTSNGPIQQWDVATGTLLWTASF
jgi:WD40 repeat protein